MIEDILVPLGAIVVAELGDKTQLSILLLSSKTNRYLHLLLGVILAFVIVDGIAIVAGQWITTQIPERPIKIAAGVVFIVFGIVMLIKKEKEDETKKVYKSVFLSGFLMIFLTEWGDKTQIAAALFATKYNALFVFVGTIIALTLVSILAVFCGKILAKYVNKKVLTKVAAVVFIIMGIVFFL